MDAVEADDLGRRACRLVERRAGDLFVLGLDEQQVGLRIVEQLADLAGGEADVQADADGADLGAGGEQLGDLDAVGGEHGDAVAGADAERAQAMAERVRAGVELGPGNMPVNLDKGVVARAPLAVAARQPADGQHAYLAQC